MSFSETSVPMPTCEPIDRRDEMTDYRECVRERLNRKFGSILEMQRELFPYDVERLSALLHRLCCIEGLGQRAIVSPFVTGQHLAVWTEFVPSVTCICDHSQPELENFHVVENSRVYDLPAGDTHWLFKFRDETLRYQGSRHDAIDLLVIEDQRYELSIVNYFIFKKLLSTRQAVIVLVHGPRRGRTGGFNARFVENLASGKVDGLSHQFESFINPASGCGFSVEMHGQVRQTHPADPDSRATLPTAGPECTANAA